MGIQELDQVAGEERVHGIKVDLVDLEDLFLLTVILVDLEWGSMVVVPVLDSKGDQAFQAEAGEEEVVVDQCKQTMNQGYLARTRVHLERKIWNRKVMVRVWETIKWVEIQWQGIIGIRTFLHLDTDSLGGEAPGLVCQGVPTLDSTPYLHN